MRSKLAIARTPRGVMRRTLVDLLPDGWRMVSNTCAHGPEGFAIGRTVPEVVMLAQAKARDAAG